MILRSKPQKAFGEGEDLRAVARQVARQVVHMDALTKPRRIIGNAVKSMGDGQVALHHGVQDVDLLSRVAFAPFVADDMQERYHALHTAVAG